MTNTAKAYWRRLGGRIIVVRPVTEAGLEEGSIEDGTEIVSDVSFTLKDWFATNRIPMVVLRPDRFVAAAGGPQEISAVLDKLSAVLW
ncbi:hypothetical protein AB4144_53180, partial [Rhizobiaceae sp. 2RAB30]